MAGMDPASAERYSLLPGRGPGFQVASADGCFLVTPDGRRILDAAGGAIVVNIGHGRSEVAEVASAALKNATYLVPPFASPERVRLVERLRTSWLPAGIERCAFATGGSESMDLACRIARQHFVAKGEPSRWKVIGRELSYHGTSLSTLDIGGHLKRRAVFGPWLHDDAVPKALACYPLRCAACAGSCNLDCADGIERAILAAGPETVAAVAIEPIGGSTAGALVPPDDYLPRVAEICRRHGVLLIADEVMCGFGRTGARFAVDHWGVVPDMLVGGKGLAGGYAAMGGVYLRPEVVEAIAAGGQDVMFTTFGAQPASCAIADKVLEILEREELVARAARMGAQLRERLIDAFAEHPHVAEIRGRGLLQALEIVRDRETREPFAASDRITATLVAAGLSHGVFFYPGGCGPAQDVVCLGPPFIIRDDELELLVTALTKAFDAAVTRAASRA
jgi:adenosylmethionine-8-amino-7-oxononanoate aminotransferase